MEQGVVRLVLDREVREGARVEDDGVRLRDAEEMREQGEPVQVLVPEHPSRLGVVGLELLDRTAALVEVVLLVVSEDGFVPHGELDALASPGAAVDEVSHEDDAVARGDREAREELESLVVAPVEVGHDDRAGGASRRCAGAGRRRFVSGGAHDLLARETQARARAVTAARSRRTLAGSRAATSRAYGRP